MRFQIKSESRANPRKRESSFCCSSSSYYRLTLGSSTLQYWIQLGDCRWKEASTTSKFSKKKPKDQGGLKFHIMYYIPAVVWMCHPNPMCWKLNPQTLMSMTSGWDLWEVGQSWEHGLMDYHSSGFVVKTSFLWPSCSLLPSLAMWYFPPCYGTATRPSPDKGQMLVQCCWTFQPPES